MSKEYDQYVVKSGDNLSNIAEQFGLTLEQMIALNPDLADDSNSIQIGQELNIPDLTPPEFHQYVVEQGDSLSIIARERGVSLTDLMSFNPLLDNPNSLEVGQRINVPGPGHEAYESYAAQVDGRLQNYTIKSGDTLSEIAHVRGLSTEALMRMNDIRDAGNIRAGQVIQIPFESTIEHIAQPREIYKVQSGDTFSEIADQHNVSQRALEQANPDIANTGRLSIGQRINIPESDQPEGLAPLKPASDETLALGITQAQTDQAWDAVEGKTSRAAFQQVSNTTRDHLPVVVIDPGHGADNNVGRNDPGAVGANALSEVAVVDPVALALGEQLRQQGFRVAYTRNPGEEYRYGAADGPGRLGSRSEFAHALEDELDAPYTIFVSLHANAAVSDQANGFEVLVDSMGRGRSGPATNPESVSLAHAVLGKIDGYENLNNRGLKTYNARVLDVMENGDPADREANPDAAILVEVGFLSNPGDLEVLTDMRENPNEMASRIAAGITEYADNRADKRPEQEPGMQIADGPGLPGPGAGS